MDLQLKDQRKGWNNLTALELWSIVPSTFNLSRVQLLQFKCSVLCIQFHVMRQYKYKVVSTVTSCPKFGHLPVKLKSDFFFVAASSTVFPPPRCHDYYSLREKFKNFCWYLAKALPSPVTFILELSNSAKSLCTKSKSNFTILPIFWVYFRVRGESFNFFTQY